MNFTSSLPQDILEKLSFYSRKFDLPKNQILEKALLAYFEQLKKAEYAYSFKAAAKDQEMGSLAEEGLEEYLKILEEG
jgi:hypothetical protein